MSEKLTRIARKRIWEIMKSSAEPQWGAGGQEPDGEPEYYTIDNEKAGVDVADAQLRHSQEEHDQAIKHWQKVLIALIAWVNEHQFIDGKTGMEAVEIKDVDEAVWTGLCSAVLQIEPDWDAVNESLLKFLDALVKKDCDQAIKETLQAVGEVLRRDLEAIEVELEETQSGLIGFPTLEKHIRCLKQGTLPEGMVK